RSNSSVCASSSASGPVAATRVAKPAARRPLSMNPEMRGSSSAIKMDATYSVPFVRWRARKRRLGRNHQILRRDRRDICGVLWHADDEEGSAALAIFYPHGATVRAGDHLDDTQPQPAPASAVCVGSAMKTFENH